MNLYSFIKATLCIQALVCYTDKQRANKHVFCWPGCTWSLTLSIVWPEGLVLIPLNVVTSAGYVLSQKNSQWCQQRRVNHLIKCQMTKKIPWKKNSFWVGVLAGGINWMLDSKQEPNHQWSMPSHTGYFPHQWWKHYNANHFCRNMRAKQIVGLVWDWETYIPPLHIS